MSVRVELFKRNHAKMLKKAMAISIICSIKKENEIRKKKGKKETNGCLELSLNLYFPLIYTGSRQDDRCQTKGNSE